MWHPVGAVDHRVERSYTWPRSSSDPKLALTRGAGHSRPSDEHPLQAWKQRVRLGVELPGLAERYPVSAQAVADVHVAEAVCSGVLSRSALELAERAAVAAALHGTEGDGEKNERTDEPEAIVEKLSAQGLRGWALGDCRYRLERLAALDRHSERFPSRILADATR